MSEWFESWFETDTWLRIHEAYWRDRAADEVAERLESVMALPTGSRILDVPCGIGRLSAALADRGHRVHGVDLSEMVLAAARSHAGDRTVTFERGDMREVEGSSEFDGAICWWGSFGYFGDEGDEAFVRAVRRALKPGAPFLIEGFVMESLLPGFQASGVGRFDDVMFVEERHLDLETSTIESTWTVLENGAVSGRTDVRVRLYPWLTLRALLNRAGFEHTTLLDAGTLEPFVASSRMGRTLTLAR
ncbi:MAG: class I SAM-dependent methyltransferase [Deltaproteobacteria bacterium]|nr:class I SAM-dependent methyltransferase [Deltaproteobacteria bacterium]